MTHTDYRVVTEREFVDRWANQEQYTTIHAYSRRHGVAVQPWIGNIPVFEFPAHKDGKARDYVAKRFQDVAESLGWTRQHGFALGAVQEVTTFSDRGHYRVTVWRDKSHVGRPYPGQDSLYPSTIGGSRA